MNIVGAAKTAQHSHLNGLYLIISIFVKILNIEKVIE